jgi:alpha-mannosidase
MALKPWTKFTYSEMKFFSMWYYRQSEDMKNRVKQYVKEGRFEFTNGGWSANDEACPTFNDIIDNMLIGHEFLMKEFGIKPRAAWLIDSFGHSSTNARIYADIGFEAMFISRMDVADKFKRFDEKKL